MREVDELEGTPGDPHAQRHESVYAADGGAAPIVVDRIFEALGDANRAGVGMLLVEQDVLRAFNIAQRSYVLSQGRVVKAGPCQELAVDPEVQRICLGA